MKRLQRLLIVLLITMFGLSFVFAEDSDFKTNIEKGSKGEDVLLIQQRLSQLGYFDGKPNGIFDNKTEKAVKKFQQETDSIVTGKMENENIEKLRDMAKEYSKRALIVALTNERSYDVFMEDGTNYNVSKFHKYSDLHEEYMVEYEDGVWSEDQNAWLVDKIILYMENFDIYIKVSARINFDGKNYIVSNVSYIVASLEYIYTGDEYEIFESMKLEPSKKKPFLTVPLKLIKEDRNKEDIQKLKDDIQKKEEDERIRQEWVSSQFSLWDGSHKGLEKLIKKALNDEGSYKHIRTVYYDISTEGMEELLNDALKEVGSKVKVKIGDLLIMTEFSAKNVFGAIIKSMAIGIADFNTNKVVLLDVR